jgi:hypothetical protein
MKRIELKYSDKKAREYKYFLSRLYNNNRVGLKKLIEMAVIKAVNEGAQKELDQARKELEDMGE